MSERRFPEELENVFERVRSQVVWLHGRWIIYRQLYGSSEERIDLLNESASTFFFVIQETLMDDVQLTLSKLADPAKKGGNKNLTLETLYGVVASLGEDELCAKLQDSLTVLVQRKQESLGKWITHLNICAVTKNINKKVKVKLEGSAEF